MKHLTFILFFVFLFAASQNAQTCDLDLNQSPKIRGVKLGMTKDEAIAALPNDRRVQIPNNDIYRVYPKLSRAKGYENIEAIELEFFQDSVYKIEISYNRSAAKWRNARQFAANLSANLNVPFKFWQFERRNPKLAKMQCKEFLFSLNADINQIELKNTLAEKDIKKVEDEKRKVFKP